MNRLLRSACIAAGLLTLGSPEPEIYHLEHPGTQTVLTMAMPSITRSHPDDAALMLATEILGGAGLNKTKCCAPW